MRDARQLFLVIILTMSCAGVMLAASYAAPSRQTSAAGSANEKSANPDSAPPYEEHPLVAGHAASADDGKLRKEGTPGLGGTSEKTHPRSGAGLTSAHRPEQLQTGRKSSEPGNAANLHQPASGKSGSGKSGATAKGRSTQNLAVSSAPRVRPSSIVRPAVASLNPSPIDRSPINVRHHGPNPAVVGGSANSNSNNAGGINGTRMHRKP
jgi:hypothetical protein